ncbi:plasmid partitioning protein RepB (plasmid) [Rhizobium sophoriradicis]|uniref:plasmid partitioning protein RepB n=1 Tax=Rhizobium sophoriradicis TaxID=1535245 RepID=UPI00220FBC39|nr:plasmid partitioning protein RepB [Rhizobium leguminosarum bv. phaseoli]
MNKRRDAMRDMLAPITGGPDEVPRQLKPVVQSGALRSMNAAFESLTQDAEAAEELRAQIAAGASIVEIDPSDIDASFIKDRLDAFDTEDFEILQESLASHGQILPVLVRRHPQKPSTYQLAFGHRRVEALRRLGMKVKAVVRDMGDDDLIIAQGKENLERKNLSFIERALFAKRLEERGMKREVILAALSVHKGNLSTMISLTRQVPEELIVAIGAAPKIGRPRWEQLANYLASNEAFDWRTVIKDNGFRSLGSDERFEHVAAAAAPPRSSQANSVTVSTRQGERIAEVETNARKTKVTINEKMAPNFAAFLVEQLPEIYENFRAKQNRNAD